jgi:hypothetical protein
VSSPIGFEENEISNRTRALTLTVLAKEAPPRKRFTNAVLGIAAAIHFEVYASEHRRVPQEIVRSPKDASEHEAELPEVIFDLIRKVDADEPPPSPRGETRKT